MKQPHRNTKTIFRTGIAAISGFVVLTALYMVRGPAPEQPEPLSHAAAPKPGAVREQGRASPRTGGTMRREATDAGQDKPPVRTLDAMDAESVMISRQLQRTQLEEYRRHSRENPDAPDAMSERKLAEMEQMQLMVH